MGEVLCTLCTWEPLKKWSRKQQAFLMGVIALPIEAASTK